jgi:hypothetical protein
LIEQAPRTGLFKGRSNGRDAISPGCKVYRNEIDERVKTLKQ